MQYPAVDIQDQKVPMLAVRSTIEGIQEQSIQEVEAGATWLCILPHPPHTDAHFFCRNCILLVIYIFIILRGF